VVDKPVPGKGQVLIKVDAIPLNPGDIYNMEGLYDAYMNYKYPFVTGWEGSGTVVASGGGLHAWYMQGKRVAFTKCDEEMVEGATIKIGGTMAQYSITNAYQCVPIDDDVSLDDAASFFINPLTALGLVEQVTNDKGKAVILTAAASQLAKMMIPMLHDQGITVIATVRKEEHVKELKETYDVKHVFNTDTDENFLADIKTLTREIDCKHLLECVGGSMFGKITSMMPKGSKCILYGNLSKNDVSDIDSFVLMGQSLTITGFFLGDYLQGKSLFGILRTINKVKKLFKKELSTNIQKKYHLKDIHEALEFYKNNMSGGKVIVKPWGVEEETTEK
jgi:NADPH:quinone reductase-like Zn-dependent oxidoreductase